MVSHAASTTLLLIAVASSNIALPLGPIGFMPNDRDTFAMIDNCVAARTKFNKDFGGCSEIQLLGLTDLAYLDKKCRFFFRCVGVHLNISRTIDISATEILKLSKRQIFNMLTNG